MKNEELRRLFARMGKKFHFYSICKGGFLRLPASPSGRGGSEADGEGLRPKPCDLLKKVDQNFKTN